MENSSITTAFRQTPARAARKGVVGLLGRFAVELRHRIELRAKLGTLSDRHLRDIGLCSADVSALDHLSLSASSGREMQAVRRSRSSNW